MTPHELYPLFNLGILLPWALLVFAPRWKPTQVLLHGAIVPAAICATYGALLVATWPSIPEDANGSSLAGVMRMFDEPWLALVCWVHYLTFDLFVGAWQARDAARRGLPHLAVAPCLVATLFFGPAGLLLYLGLRFALRKTLSLHEGPAPIAQGAPGRLEPTVSS
jgi:hypothetical protein